MNARSIFPETFDPLLAANSPEAIVKHGTSHLARAQAIAMELRSLAMGKGASELSWENTAARFDDVIAELSDAQGFAALMEVTHPRAAVRDAARTVEPMVDALRTSIYLDSSIAAVLKAYAAKNEPLDGERARFLAEALRDFRRNGLDLPEEQQAELRKLNAELTLLGQRFQTNIDGDTKTIAVPEESLRGLPPDYLAKHPVVDGKATISTDYPDYFPFITHSEDRRSALDLYTKFTNRGGDENVKLLEQILDLRQRKAKLLGYACWADYATEPRMAKSSTVVRDFLRKIEEAVRAPAAAEFVDFLKEHVARGAAPKDKITGADRAYLDNKVKQKKFAFDSKALAEYFDVSRVIEGLLTLSSKLYDLELRKVDEPSWHPDVTTYEIVSGGAKVGKFFLDLYPRTDKYKHAAMFPIVTGKRLHDGSYRKPVAALVCNFPQPSRDASSPALMTHEDVTVFFHEFGHLLHCMLAESELSSFAGTNTVQDFVEVPSQMFEEWAWTREVLDLFARHYKTGALIPDSLYGALLASRGFGRALATQRQLLLATIDFEYHSRAPGFDTTKLLEELQTRMDSFAYVPGTHFQSNFAHLIGYDAGYYGYQWALSLSRDVLTRFQREGMMNTTTAGEWRTRVLSKGGGTDERDNVAKFLGREPNEEAYVSFIQGK